MLIQVKLQASARVVLQRCPASHWHRCTASHSGADRDAGCPPASATEQMEGVTLQTPSCTSTHSGSCWRGERKEIVCSHLETCSSHSRTSVWLKMYSKSKNIVSSCIYIEITGPFYKQDCNKVCKIADNNKGESLLNHSTFPINNLTLNCTQNLGKWKETIRWFLTSMYFAIDSHSTNSLLIAV